MPEDPKPTDDPTTQRGGTTPVSGEGSILWVLWATYGAFYFCRTNISAAVPGMQLPVEEGGLALSATQTGLILGSLKIAYAFGQLLNGQLSEQFSPRRLLAIGMLGSAALNVLFGLSTAFYFLLFVWACNGYCQSLGWTPCVRVTANWIPFVRRGKAIGLIGTGYQVTLGLTYIVAGFSADPEYLGFGWRGAFYVPAVLLTLGAIFMLVFLRETPPGASDRRSLATGSSKPTSKWSSVIENLVLTLSNPALWFLGVSLGLLNACRYGFLDWGLTHLKEVQDTGVARAGLKYAVLPIGAVAGSYLSGWASDRFFGGRRAPVICLLLVLLSGLTLAYDPVARSSVPGTLCLLVAIGFCIYGPQVLLVGTAPADLARRGTSAAAAGFVNFMGYVGAFSGDLVTGRLVDQYDWQVAVTVWAGWALAAAVAVGFLWTVTPSEED